MIAQMNIAEAQVPNSYITFYTHFQGIQENGCNAGRVKWVHFEWLTAGYVYNEWTYTNSCGAATFGPFNGLGDTVTYWVKGDKWLAVRADVDTGGTNNLTVILPQAPAGDASNDNLVNSTDFVILHNSYGLSCGSSYYDPRADFNEDCVVDGIDFNYLRTTFGTEGPPALY